MVSPSDIWLASAAGSPMAAVGPMMICWLEAAYSPYCGASGVAPTYMSLIQPELSV